MLRNENLLPRAVKPLLEKHVALLVGVLGRKLTGVYVHGSAAMGGFSPDQSDVDYIALVSEPLSGAERSSLSDGFLAIFGEDAPANGVEMSIVVERFAGKEFRYPTPYEFHMGSQEQVRLHGRPHAGEMTDPDLAAHFTIIYRRGVCVYGRSIEEVFAAVPKQDYLASIGQDSAESYGNIFADSRGGECVVPRYAVLNFCRVLGVIEADLVLSKVEGAEWALANLPQRFAPVIVAALNEYRKPGYGHTVDQALLKEFATYAMEMIRPHMGKSSP